MARIRTVKPEFFRHEGLFDAERESGLPLRVAFAGLWTACDKSGRFVWKPRSLKLDCLPHDDVDFSRVLDALASRGFVLRYTVDGVEYGCVPSWFDHQVPNNKERESEIPPPPKDQGGTEASTREARVDDASATPLGKDRVEREQGREGKGMDSGAAVAPHPPSLPASLFQPEPERPEPKPRSKNAAALPEGWEPPEKLRLWAKATVPLVDVDLETEKFRNHAAAIGRTAKDWGAAWKNWLLKAEEIRASKPSYQQRPAPAANASPDDQWSARVQRFASSGFWYEAWGQPPGKPGCTVPPSVLHQHGYRTEAA